ncbi:hypothetical protein HHK36_016036 [Tetracentron sinense]|uniref:Epidermal patterning factor-like protein n=1 Tax=Tetracentron sinense TaxID=13715 RepID=A0A835DEC0_TETSI|nr:hypothetical protein HHK36_016036 [Tetracentron sinense]
MWKIRLLFSASGLNASLERSDRTAEESDDGFLPDATGAAYCCKLIKYAQIGSQLKPEPRLLEPSDLWRFVDMSQLSYTLVLDFQKTGEKRKNIEGISISRSKSWVSRSLTRRNLSGAGSWPPRCTSKCGKCKPCKPVRVTIPPGRPVTTEYYPEAWRCKCGNKLYLP